MEHIDRTSARIEEQLKDYHPNDTPGERAAFITQQFKYWLDDALKLVKNIKETSLGEADLQRRLIEAETKFGIPKTHLL